MNNDPLAALTNYSSVEDRAFSRYQQLKKSLAGNDKELLDMIRAYSHLGSYTDKVFYDTLTSVGDLLGLELPKVNSNTPNDCDELIKIYFPDEWTWLCQSGIVVDPPDSELG